MSQNKTSSSLLILRAPLLAIAGVALGFILACGAGSDALTLEEAASAVAPVAAESVVAAPVAAEPPSAPVPVAAEPTVESVPESMHGEWFSPKSCLICGEECSIMITSGNIENGYTYDHVHFTKRSFDISAKTPLTVSNGAVSYPIFGTRKMTLEMVGQKLFIKQDGTSVLWTKDRPACDQAVTGRARVELANTECSTTRRECEANCSEKSEADCKNTCLDKETQCKAAAEAKSSK